MNMPAEPHYPLGFKKSRIYSAAGKLLLSEGNALRSEAQRERLLTIGAYREADASEHKPTDPAADDTVLISTAAHATPGPLALEPRPARFPILPTGIEQFQLTSCAGNAASFYVRYVGAIAGLALLIMVQGESEDLQVGTELEAKVIFGRAVYAFRTRVAARDSRIPGLFQLEYPATIKRHTIRKHVRIDTRLSARLIRNDVVATGFDAQITNLCASGIGFFLPDATLEIGEHFKIAVRLKVDAREHAIVFHCIARNRSCKGNGLTVGAEFNALPDETRRLTQAYIFQQATGTSQG
ncbi:MULTISPECIES: flagellar brake protein [Burkholderiaceae]|uniref:flagellar brake protein n=1 Tax=Burkholderiaceae TaxID=119060 RepID=UPI0009EB97F7|nr:MULTISPECIES: PilZ domain-containing protein [Burkholderiaceae]